MLIYPYYNMHILQQLIKTIYIYIYKYTLPYIIDILHSLIYYTLNIFPKYH